VFKERELIKSKRAEEWQQEEHLRIFFIETIKQLQHSGIEKQPVTVNESSLQNNWVGLLNNPTMTQPVVSNQINEVNQQPVILE
jgi:hypothetical protein